MWPWEHLAFGYILYSGYSRVRHRQPPAEGATVVLAVATQFPDLVDKPLAWTFGVLPSGTTLAHSALTAVPVIFLSLLVARRFGRSTYAEAFAVGYGSHLLGDAGYRLFIENESIGFLLWPVVPQPGDDPVGFFSKFQEYLGDFVGFLATSEGTWYLVIELGLLGATILLWTVDGWPGLHPFLTTLRGGRRS